MAIELDLKRVADQCVRQFTVVSHNGEHICHFGLLQLCKDGPFISMHLGDSKPGCTMAPRSICDLATGDPNYFNVIKATKEICKAVNSGLISQSEPQPGRRKELPTPKPIIRRGTKKAEEEIPIARMGFNPGKYTCANCATPIPDGGVCPNCN